MIEVTDEIYIDEAALDESFCRASGPGGQNVNKVSTAVILRFDVAGSDVLPPEVRKRLIRLAGKQMTDDGFLVIRARRFRTRERNRQDARERLVRLIQKACAVPKKRKKTKPGRDAIERRLEEKRRRSKRKSMRSKPPETD